MLPVQSQEANMRSLQSLRNVRLHPFLEKPQQGRQTSKCARRKLINQGIFARCVPYVCKVSAGSCLKPLATSALELCDTSPAGVVAVELCPSRSKGNWEVFLQGIYSQRRKPTDTHEKMALLIHTPVPWCPPSLHLVRISFPTWTLDIEKDTTICFFIDPSIHVSI